MQNATVTINRTTTQVNYFVAELMAIAARASKLEEDLGEGRIDAKTEGRSRLQEIETDRYFAYDKAYRAMYKGVIGNFDYVLAENLNNAIVELEGALEILVW